MIAHSVRAKRYFGVSVLEDDFAGVSLEEQAENPVVGSSSAIDTTCGYLT